MDNCRLSGASAADYGIEPGTEDDLGCLAPAHESSIAYAQFLKMMQGQVWGIERTAGLAASDGVLVAV